MLYQGSKLSVTVHESVAELRFDAQDGSVNKFDTATLAELGEAGAALTQAEGLTGLLIISAKPTFIVGADITEFGALFRQSDEALTAWAIQANKGFSAIEDLGVPSVVAVNGLALGGGFEMCLAADYRVMAHSAKIGFPETGLGIIPGFGGTVRFPRLVGAEPAIEWIVSGKHNGADVALRVGAVDVVVSDEQVESAARDLLRRAIAGELDWPARNEQKKSALGQADAVRVFETARARIAQQSKGFYPAPVEAVDRIQAAAGMTRDAAIEQEAAGFVKLAKTPEADALIGLFLNDQVVKRKSRSYAKAARKVEHAAVLGAGIMGGGIACLSALKGVQIVMKDIAEDALQLGLDEAAKHCDKRVSQGRMATDEVAVVMDRIRATLDYDGFADVDIVIEAVVENPGVKKSVLAQTEQAVGEQAVIASNTSSISIDDLATALQRPQRFLGMHFFNPVHAMPLVEVIKGGQTSETAIATVVAYASRLGKTPIVVKNCPGFLVNRILFPYLAGFQLLVSSGVDFTRIDKVMQSFGWPMGPAHLSDVVGLDTCQHIEQVLAEGYPDRMGSRGESSLALLVEEGRYGQKTGVGYYRYEKDERGKPGKQRDEVSDALIVAARPDGKREAGDGEIVERMMLPLIIEAARCLEEGIAGTAGEVDTGLILGLGFPRFRGGALKYADRQGLAWVVDRADAHADLGPLYQPTERMRQMAIKDGRYYG
ncbi:MAG: fatty acid oxidation complex subunit alpha FadB [Salinisphaera sp.]|nr:fatty acid oxidation complex subunit alpha FadB [Salinisphaera sp.]